MAPRAHGDPVKALTRIAGQPEDSKTSATLTDPFMFQDYYGYRTVEPFAKVFGPNFALGLFQLNRTPKDETASVFDGIWKIPSVKCLE